MGWFRCKSKEPRYTEWQPSDEWRAVELYSGAVKLERRHIRTVLSSEFLEIEREWRFVGAFNTVDACWSERHRIRLKEGLVVHYPPKEVA